MRVPTILHRQSQKSDQQITICRREDMPGRDLKRPSLAELSSESVICRPILAGRPNAGLRDP